MADQMQAWVSAMRAGRFDQAWALSEQDLKARDPATCDDPTKPYHLRWVWDGRSFDGRHVLVRCYHGLGDTIQFARYLPLLAQRAASVTLEVQPQLIALLTTLPGVSRLFPFDPAHPLPPSECDIEIMELAFALRARPDALSPPYLHAPLTVPERDAPTIGICPIAGDWDAARCVPADMFEPICHDHSCMWLVPGSCALPVRNPEGCTLDMLATVSLVASCALVITVDTMVAHLAGALGRPTWLLLKAEPDWRWSPGRTSIWYPSMRLYRQPRAGDWSGVLAEVKLDLERLDLTAPAMLVEG